MGFGDPPSKLILFIDKLCSRLIDYPPSPTEGGSPYLPIYCAASSSILVDRGIIKVATSEIFSKMSVSWFSTLSDINY